MADIISAEPPTHKDIIDRNGGPAALARAIDADANTVKAWKRLSSIPAPYWQAIADAELASLAELAEAAAARRADRAEAA